MHFGCFLILMSREAERTEFNFMVPKISVWNIAVQEQYPASPLHYHG